MPRRFHWDKPVVEPQQSSAPTVEFNPKAAPISSPAPEKYQKSVKELRAETRALQKKTEERK